MTLALLPGETEAGYTFGVLWRLFGTTNQLTAGLALAVIAVWVTSRRRNPIAVIIPLVFLLSLTTWALFIQLFEFIEAGEWVLAPLDAIIFVLAVWLIIEAAIALRRTMGQRHLPPVDADVDDEGAAAVPGPRPEVTAEGGSVVTEVKEDRS
jgi:carbon starvation protein